ncbi:MAG: ribose-phosphate pyrophosphokinase-like domain-containing protein, partial [Syntrophobacteria bacterium]
MATVGMRVISGNSNPSLVETICDYLGISLCRARVDRFNDGETLVEIG